MKCSSVRFLALAGMAALLAACNLPGTQSATPTVLLVTPLAPVETLAPSPTHQPSPTAAPTNTTSAAAPTPTSAVGGQKVAVNSLRMLDLQNGWGVGNLQKGVDDILFTHDGGASWKIVTPPQAASQGLSAVAAFLDASHAWVTYAAQPGGNATSEAVVYRTADGGSSWQNAKVKSSTTTLEFFSPGQIGFSDSQNGWMLVHMGVGMMHDYVSIWTTSDGGASWKAVVDSDKDNLSMSCYKNSIWFPTPQRGFMAGSCGGVMKGLFMYDTKDGGATWSLTNLPAPAGHADLFTNENNVNEADELAFKDSNFGTVLVRSTAMAANKSTHWLYVTQDGGQTWKSYALPTAWGNLAYLDAQHLWYLGATAADSYEGTGMFTSSDGGAHWKNPSTVNWTGPIQFADAKNGWVLAKAGANTALVRSKDGGMSWTIVNPVLIP